MNNEKIIVALVLVSLALSAASLFGQPQDSVPEQSTLDNIRAAGAIDACYITYPTLSYKDLETGEMKGITVEIIESIAEKMNVKVNYIETTWGNLVLDVKSGRCHINISAIFPLIERASGGVMFSEPFGYLGNNGIVLKDNERFHSLEELNSPDVTVAVIEGEQGHEYARKHLPNANLHIIPSGDISLAFTEVSAGRADVGLGDSISTELYLREHDDVRLLLDKPYLLRELTFVVNENDLKLLNFMDNAIDVLATSGELEEIFARYPLESVIPRTAQLQQ